MVSHGERIGSGLRVLWWIIVVVFVLLVLYILVTRLLIPYAPVFAWLIGIVAGLIVVVYLLGYIYEDFFDDVDSLKEKRE